MIGNDAETLVVVMHGEWPAGGWVDERGELTTRGRMFALVFADYPADAGAEAVTRLRSRIPYRTGPQTADIKAVLREVIGETTGAPALPPADGVPSCCRGAGFGHFYRDHADDALRGRVDALMTDPGRRRDTTVQSAFLRVVAGT